MKSRETSPTEGLVAVATTDLFSLFITVSGPTASGKSTVAFIIEKALREAGANVTVKTDLRNPDAYRETLESRAEVMVKGRKIIITENRDLNSCHR